MGRKQNVAIFELIDGQGLPVLFKKILGSVTLHQANN